MGNRGLHTLVIDHDGLVRKLLCTLVEHPGGKAIEAGDGREGLAKARELRPDIIVTDWLLPVMGGIELVRALRADQETYRPYIILATGLDDEDKLVEAFDAGVDDFIGKPLRMKIAAARLRAAQRMVRLQRENKDHIAELQRFSVQLTRSNLRLRELAVTDELTGLPNRRYAMERMQQEWSAANRHRSPLSCLVVDLDGLKQINDVHGHERGDVVLKTVAAVVKKQVRTQDVVCRISGDEFLVICPGTSLDAVMTCGERLVSAVAAFGIHAEGYSLSLSVGAAEHRPEMEDPQDLFSLAQQSMEHAKRQGRNQIYSGQEKDLVFIRGLRDPQLNLPEPRSSQGAVVLMPGRRSLA